MTAARIRLVLCDDHAIVLAGLAEVLSNQPDLEVVGTCADGAQAVALIRSLRPDVAILDVKLPGMDGLAVVRALRDDGVTTRFILLTAVLDDVQALEAMQLQIPGIVLKEMHVDRLVECIRQVHAGGESHAPEAVRGALRRVMSDDQATPSSLAALTPRELEIVRMVAVGMRNKEVASSLGIAEGTVKIHLHRIYEKLGVEGRIELIFWAQAHGVVA